jgi:serine protease AprX
MAQTPSGSPHARTIAIRGLAFAIAIVFAAVPVWAQRHHSRLSADLVDHLRAQSAQIDVIVHGDQATVEALVARYNLQVKKVLKDSAVIRVNAGQLSALEQDETIDHLSGDTIIRASADVTAESIGADQLWAGEGRLKGVTGDGISVAVIDTGMDLRHSALRGRVIFTKDFTGGDGIDRFGHGTHVAGIIAGAGGQTADTRDYRGIAYGANLVNLRALGDDGSGTVSTVVEAIDWAIDHRHQLGIRVINLSLGTPVLQPYRDDPLCEAVERAVTAGIVVVAAAGNYGRSVDGKTVLGSITSPGNSPYALTVGALDTHGTPQRSDDTLASYSSRGPTRFDLIIKPDVSAPGSHIVSAEASGAAIPQAHPERHVAGGGSNAYMELSGTSMAAAVVSGAVALLLDQRPALTAVAVKASLQLTASSVIAQGFLGVGTGSLNVLAASKAIEPRSVRSDSCLLVIGGEQTTAQNTAFVPEMSRTLQTQTILWTRSVLSTHAIVWGKTIVSGDFRDTIIRGLSGGDTIIWGQGGGDTIIWGQGGGDTIIWGQGGGDTIIWGQEGGDTIIWGQESGDTIIWGQEGGDTIIWGQESGDTIIWGQDFVA